MILRIGRLLTFLAVLGAPWLVSASPPTLQETLAATRSAQGTSEAPDPWSNRARWRALMPRVNAGFGTDVTEERDLAFKEYVGRDESGVPFIDTTQNASEDDRSEKVTWRVTLTWDLRDSVFSAAELAAAREARARRTLRIRLDFEAMEAFRAWQTASDDFEAANAAARLDVLTDGWFTRRIGGRP